MVTDTDKMNSRIERALARVLSGKLNRRELEAFRKNTLKIDNADEVIDACDEMLAKLPRSRTGKSKKESNDIAEKGDGYVIMSSAYNEDGKLRRPELVDVAKEIARYPLVNDVAILKTQIRFYYKGRHMTAGCHTDSKYFRIGILDESKIMDSTIEAWKKIGEVKSGDYFTTRYINVSVKTLAELHNVLENVSFS